MPLEGIQNILPRIQARGFCGTGQTALRRRSDAHQGKFLGLIKLGSIYFLCQITVRDSLSSHAEGILVPEPSSDDNLDELVARLTSACRR